MDLLEKAQSLLQECNDIITLLESWRAHNPSLEVDGLQKMTSALIAEQKFLDKVASTSHEDIKAVQINSSNVPYLRSLVWALVQSKNPVAVRKTFDYVLDPFTVIEPTEKFKSLPSPRSGSLPANKKGGSVMRLQDSSSTVPLSPSFTNVQSFQVKVDLVADHGKSWLRINAGSVWSMIHEFAGMEDSDSEDEDDSQVEDHEESQVGQKPRLPTHVSKETHPDLTLLTRSLVLAADQNRLHYFHRPLVSLRFAGILPQENQALEGLIQRSVTTGQYAFSIAEQSPQHFPLQVEYGQSEPSFSTLCSASAAEDPHFQPFSIPQSVDDMVLFTKTLNLDITTLMALSSKLCHTIRPDSRIFTSPPLILQAEQEHGQPLLPFFAKIFSNRDRLVITRAAAVRFNSILSIIGGPEEQWRGSVMIQDPDHILDSTKSSESRDEAKIKERWVAGSDWARHYGVFADGPPRIEIIEDWTREGGEGESDGEEGEDCVGEQQDQDPDQKQRPRARKMQNMTDLHSKIFMTGHLKRLTTLTANLVGFRTVTRTGQVPADISVWFHSPRSLAEAKAHQSSE